jgi:hypothetical protein
MWDYILYGLSAGILVFLVLFIISFITLGSIAAVVHLAGTFYQHLFITKTPVYHYVPSRPPVWTPDSAPQPRKRLGHRKPEFSPPDSYNRPIPSDAKVRRLTTLMSIKWPTCNGSSG